MKKAVIFDLDGTLLNTLDSIAFCGNTALSHFGFKNVSINEYPQFIGKGAPALFDKLYKYVGGDPEKYDEFFEYAMEVYNEYGNKNIKTYDGIYQMLDQLKEKGIKCAVLSNKPHCITKEVCDNFFNGRFEAVYGQRQGTPKKPDPFMMNELLKELKCDAKDCLYCGDSDIDVLTAKNSGVTMLGAAWGFYNEKPFADIEYIIHHPTEIIKYI